MIRGTEAIRRSGMRGARGISLRSQWELIRNGVIKDIGDFGRRTIRRNGMIRGVGGQDEMGRLAEMV